jgi:vancomycin resistance protein YoaR
VTDRSSGISPVPGPASNPNFSRRRGLVIGGGLGLLLLACYGLLIVLTGSGVQQGVSVAGVDLGGLSRAEAIAKLTSASGPAKTNLLVKANGHTYTISPSAAGLSINATATVDAVSGRSWNPFTLVGRLFGGSSVAPVVTVYQAVLSGRVTTIAGETDELEQEPAIHFAAGQPELTAGSSGVVLDKSAAEQQLIAAFPSTGRPVVLTVVTQTPVVSADAAAKTLAAARIAVSAPVTVKVDSVQAAIPRAVLADALTYPVKGSAMVPTLDGTVLRAAIAPTVSGVEQPGRDATWKIVNNKPVVVASQVGRGVNPQTLATDVAGVLTQTTAAGRTVNATIGVIPPARTTQQAQALGVTQEISSFTQDFPYAPYREQNIGQAAKYVNNTLLLPGQIYSMNDTIKERTVANGYTVGFVIGPGGIFKQDLGGGVSTATTTVWTAAFYAGMQRVHVQAHSIWISRYQAGLEATVAWGQFDMKFKNTNPTAVFITTIMRPTSLTVTMWGTKVYTKITAVSDQRTNIVAFPTDYDPTATCHAQSGQPGFGIVVNRLFWRGNTVVKREPIQTVYQPSPVVICGTDPALPKPKPTPSASPSAPAKPKPSTSKPPG